MHLLGQLLNGLQLADKYINATLFSQENKTKLYQFLHITHLNFYILDATGIVPLTKFPTRLLFLGWALDWVVLEHETSKIWETQMAVIKIGF